MVFVSLLVVVELGLPNLDQRISLDVRGRSGQEVAQALSGASGITFEASDQAALDRFVIHVDNKPLREVMDRIAEAELGEWIRLSGDRFRLRRSASRVGRAIREQQAEISKRIELQFSTYRNTFDANFDVAVAERIARSWEHLKALDDGAGVYTQSSIEKHNNLARTMPVGRAVSRILMSIGPEELAALPLDHPTVYSTIPTALQRPLPLGAAQAIEASGSEQQAWDEVTATRDYMLFEYPGQYPWFKFGQPKVAAISLSRADEASGIQATIMTAPGSAPGREADGIGMRFELPEYPEEPAPAPGPNTRRQVLPLSEVDISFARPYSLDRNARGTSAPFNRRAAALAVDPERTDPLGTFVADGLKAIASLRGENVVAVVDDRTASAFAANITDAGLDANVLESVKRRGYQSVTEKDGWILLSESRPDHADELRCNRGALHTLINAARQAGGVTLDVAAEYALSARFFNESPIPVAYLTGLLDKHAAETLRNHDRGLLRFYGSLSGEQRRAAVPLYFSALADSQRTLLLDLVFEKGRFLSVERREGEAGQEANFLRAIGFEPTFSLADGLPSSGYFTLTPLSGNGVLARLGYGGADGVAYETQWHCRVGDLAWMIANSQSPNGDNRFTVLGMRVADRNTLKFDFHYTADLRNTISLDTTLPTSPESGSVQALPEKLRTELERLVREDLAGLSQRDNGSGVRSTVRPI